MRHALFAIGTAVVACTGPIEPPAPGASQDAETATSYLEDNADGPAIVLFTIGMHIEPLGETAQGFNSGGEASYQTSALFDRHVLDILAVTRIVEEHHGRMTIQTQSPFTTTAIDSGSTILADLAASGHELALHFHEDAHLGATSETLSAQQWCDVLQQEISFIMKASGETDIRYWSGGNLFLDMYSAAQCAGLEVNSDWKDPQSQATPLEVVGVNPWRPAGGTDGVNLVNFVQHDPDGPVIFLPEGQYDQSDYASSRHSVGDDVYFEYLEQSLYASLDSAEPGKVNVFHFTIHPGEFRGTPAQPFEVIENFLTEVIDPLVASGDLLWATFSEMADSFGAWQLANPSAAPR